MPIRRLSPLLVNQIAAGEVIERPASVVKELVENAIDAGAKRIDVVIEQGGCELIRVTDDGAGMSIDDLPLALAPHATSKISTADDLDAIATMGFRGEALAAIASVSRIAIVSRPSGQTSAGAIEAEGDCVHPVRPAPGPRGTTVIVRNLFFNTPARRKFLKTQQTESMRVEGVLESLAMAHPGMAFSLVSDHRARLDLPSGQSPRERAIAVLGQSLESEMIEFRGDEAGLSIWGLTGRPSIARSSSKHQRLYLNGRGIVDRSISHAIKEAYRGLIDPTRSPTIALFLTMDPGMVDVNVHPAKAEVRFRNASAVHGAVLNAIRTALREADLLPTLQIPLRESAPVLQSWSSQMRGTGLHTLAPTSSDFGASSVGEPSGRDDGGAPTRAFVEYFRRLDPVQRGFIYSEVKQALAQDAPAVLQQHDSSHDNIDAEIIPRITSVAEILQVHSSYIVTQDAHGLIIIDQHALHERVMFEKLKARILAGDLESQRLLMPAVADVGRRQVELLDDLRPLLQRLGIEVEPISPTAIAVHGFTSLLFERGVDPVEFMTDLLDKTVNGDAKVAEEAALHEVLDMMACKAAVKAGDSLQPAELDELLKYREAIERSSSCPHGRPTSLRLTIKDLERQFGRT